MSVATDDNDDVETEQQQPPPATCHAGGGVMRRAFGRMSSLTLREGIAIALILLVCAATAVEQYLTYNELLQQNRGLHREKALLHVECELIKRQHATAYVKMEEHCDQAKNFVEFTPEHLAFRQLVFSKWPHTNNVWQWLGDVLGATVSSTQALLMAIAITLIVYPYLKRHIYGQIADEYRRRFRTKTEREMAKLVSAHAISAATLAASMRPKVASNGDVNTDERHTAKRRHGGD